MGYYDNNGGKGQGGATSGVGGGGGGEDMDQSETSGMPRYARPRSQVGGGVPSYKTSSARRSSFGSS